MKSFRFVCTFFISLFAIFLMTLAAAQSTPSAHADQPKALPGAQKQPAALAVQPASTDQPSTKQAAVDSEHISAKRFQANKLAADPAGATQFIFLPEVSYNSGGYTAVSVVIADVNGDGYPDLVVANWCASYYSCGNGGNGGEVSVLLGNGDGTFQAPVSYSSGGLYAFSVAIGDVNGDGKPDLVVVNACPSGSDCSGSPSTGVVSVLLGNGDGTFQSAVTYSSGGYWARSVAIADVNGDGHPDLVVANDCASYGSCGNGGVVTVLLGNGDGTFQPPLGFSSGATDATWVAVGDVNGDGEPDLVVANEYSLPTYFGAVGVLLGNGDGTFQAPVTYSSGWYNADLVVIADVNGDGHQDVVVDNGWRDDCSQYYCASVGVLLGNGDGTFQPVVTYSAGGDTAASVAVADVNDDGHPDLIVSNLYQSGSDYYYGSVSVLLGNGDGTFQSAVSFYPGFFNAYSVAVGDVNGDGEPDLAVAGSGFESYEGTVSVLLNNVGAPPTTTSLVASVNPVDINQTVTYTATVATPSGASVNGTVSFTDGSNWVGGGTLVNNQVSLSTSYTIHQVGTHVIAATYWGGLHSGFGSQSSPLTEYVRDEVTKTVLTTSGSPSYIGQPVTFTATVTSQSGKIPDGELVTFYDGKTVLGSVALAGGKAAYTTSTLSVHFHYIKAIYAGDNTFEPSKGTVGQAVELYPTTTALSSSPNPSKHGQPVTLTATVSSGAPGGPTGTVTFKNGAASLGKATLSGGTATLTTTKLPVGTLTLTANYSGDAQSAKSSGTTTQVVNP